MRVYSLNSYSNGSTGMIMRGIHDELKAQGHETRMAWARGRKVQDDTEFVFNSKPGVYVHGVMGRLTDSTGFHSAGATKQLIKDIEAFQPDIVHMHNVHGYCLDMRELFHGLSSLGVSVVWTLHSCWPFTGHCSYFTYVACEQWKTHCSCTYPCPQVHEFPKSLFINRSKSNFARKRELFTGIQDLTIVTPSQWLANLVGESFLRDYPKAVVPNGIDTSIFNCDVDASGIPEQLGITGQRVLLGVASPWSKRKGLEDMKNLREILSCEYAIVLVGLSKQQLKELPAGIIGLTRTDSPRELAKLYAAADLFINPTLEDNYPTVNIEALACGTRVLTYETGGSPECSDSTDECIVVKAKTPEAMADSIKSFFAEDHREIRPIVRDKSDCSKEYITVYRDILERKKRPWR